jgi:RNA polymerase sigma factor (sigma-70 family)
VVQEWVPRALSTLDRPRHNAGDSCGADLLVRLLSRYSWSAAHGFGGPERQQVVPTVASAIDGDGTEPPDVRDLGRSRTRGLAEFEEFASRERPVLVRMAYFSTRNSALAEDLAQEALLEAHRRWAEVRLADSPSAWVRRVLMNRATSHWRRRAVEDRATTELVLQGRQPGLEARDYELWDLVARTLNALDRTLIGLVHVGGYSIRDAAQLAGINENTCRSRLRRAYIRLERAWKQEDE